MTPKPWTTQQYLYVVVLIVIGFPAAIFSYARIVAPKTEPTTADTEPFRYSVPDWGKSFGLVEHFHQTDGFYESQGWEWRTPLKPWESWQEGAADVIYVSRSEHEGLDGKHFELLRFETTQGAKEWCAKRRPGEYRIPNGIFALWMPSNCPYAQKLLKTFGEF